jgi:hypothetical protein
MEWGISSTGKRKRFQTQINPPGKLSFIIEGEIKTFHDKKKLKQYVTTKLALQKFLKDVLPIKEEDKHSHERMGIITF